MKANIYLKAYKAIEKAFDELAVSIKEYPDYTKPEEQMAQNMMGYIETGKAKVVKTRDGR